MTGTRFASLREPVFAGERFGFAATLSGAGVVPTTDTGIWIGEESEGGDSLRSIAREGSDAPGTNGAKFQAFQSLVMPGSDALYFKAKLKVNLGGVSSADDQGIWVWTQSGTRLILRKGQSVDLGSGVLQVKSFEVLSTVAGSAGHGRYDAAEQRIDALVSFTNGTKAVATIGQDAGIELIALSGQEDAEGRVCGQSWERHRVRAMEKRRRDWSPSN
jgi:hypothetical protein